MRLTRVSCKCNELRYLDFSHFTNTELYASYIMGLYNCKCVCIDRDHFGVSFNGWAGCFGFGLTIYY